MYSPPFSILGECDVQLYRQMGGLRDDLAIHEKALDILVELLKKEQVCDCMQSSLLYLCSVSLNGGQLFVIVWILLVSTMYCNRTRKKIMYISTM